MLKKSLSDNVGSIKIVLDCVTRLVIAQNNSWFGKIYI